MIEAMVILSRGLALAVIAAKVLKKPQEKKA